MISFDRVDYSSMIKTIFFNFGWWNNQENPKNFDTFKKKYIKM